MCRSRTGPRPTISQSLRTFRGVARMARRAVSPPPVTTTVWRPGRSATKAPSGSTKAAAPGATRLSGVRVKAANCSGKSGTSLPDSSSARARNQTTSPVRASSSSAVSSSRAAGFARTLSATSPRTDSARAVIVARPSPWSRSIPCSVTEATPGSLDSQAKSGFRSAPVASSAIALSGSEVPA